MTASLSKDQRAQLLQQAQQALQQAHAPYSRFRVGAAVLADNGAISLGANIENASYGLTICAERVAIFTAVSRGARRIVALALSTEQLPTTPNQGMPCGACRQVMAEFMENSSSVLVDRVGSFTLDALLPRAFRLAP